MPKLPATSAKKVIKALEKLGFRVYRQTGSNIHLDIDNEAGKAGEKRISLPL